jgi:hypothetical protein
MRTVLASLLALAACSNHTDKNGVPEGEPPPPDEKAAPPPTAAPPVAPKKVLSPDELGTCHLVASGAVTADQTTKGGRDAVNVSYWLSDAERKAMAGIDGFAVNCMGPDIKFRILPGGGKIDSMPFAPKKFEFAKGKGEAATLLVQFGKAQLGEATGAVDVTAFDSHHIAGTVDLTGKLAPGGGAVTLKGEFDLVCPGFKKCDAPPP